MTIFILLRIVWLIFSIILRNDQFSYIITRRSSTAGQLSSLHRGLKWLFISEIWDFDGTAGSILSIYVIVLGSAG